MTKKIYRFLRRIVWGSPLGKWSWSFRILMVLAPFVRKVFRLSPRGDQIVLVQGHKMLFGGASEAHLDMTDGTWEPGVVTLLGERLSPGMTFVDLGAHIGFFTLMAAKLVGDKGRVYAFEPAPENFELLTKNISLNGYRNVVPIQMAVANEEGSTTLYLNPYSVAHSLHRDTFGKSRKELCIEVTTLDSYFERLGWPYVSVVKMDIEGAEPNALEGMRGLIKRNRNLVLILEYVPEILERADRDPGKLLSLIRTLGFEMFLITPESGKLELFSEKIASRKGLRAELLCQQANITAR